MSAATPRDLLIRSMRMTRVTGPAGDLIAGPELGEWIEHLADALLASPALDVLVAERVAALAEEGWVRTPSAMESVCVGTVVRSGSGTIACRYNKDLAVLLGDERPISWRALSLPLQVLWNPRAAALTERRPTDD